MLLYLLHSIKNYEVEDEIFVKDPAFLKLNIVLSVLLRIAVTAYDISLEDLRTYVRQEIVHLNLGSTQDAISIERFGRYFLQCIIHDIDATLNRESPGRFLKNLSIFVDEVMAITDALLGKDLPDAESHFKTAISILSRACLNQAFYGATSEMSVNICLSISSLEASVVGKTDSEREIRELVIPESLSAEDIVLNWWTRGLGPLHELDSFRLKLVAETVKMQPRVISFVSDFIERRTKGIVSADVPFVDGDFVKDLYDDVLGRMRAQYSPDTSFVVPSKLMSLVFGDEEVMDAASARMIRKSLYTNSVKKIITSTTFNPTGSLLMLAAMSDLPFDCEESDVDLLNPFDCMLILFRCTVGAISRGDRNLWDKGDTLEALTDWWLKCRIAVAVKTGAQTLPLGRLLPALRSCDEGSLEIPISASRIAHYFAKSDSLSQKWPPLKSDPETLTEFAKALNRSGRQSTSSPLVMYESCERQGFDQLLSFLITEPGQPPSNQSKSFLVFLDEKSCAVRDDVDSDKNQNVSEVRLRPVDSKQFRRIQSVATEMRRLHDDETMPLSAESQALVDGRFKFVYMMTHRLVEKPPLGQMLVADESDMQKFFGIMWSFVRASRGPSSA